MQRQREDGYLVSDEKDLLDLDRIHKWLSDESYWAAGRSMELIERSIEHSVAIGCYGPESTQVAFCRWVTDAATFAWLCDVYVDSDYRGKGLGTFLVESALAHPDVQGVRLLLLATRDAHGLYSKFGFVPGNASWMELRS
jgi:GNAT superfamily N-acetyltransferase